MTSDALKKAQKKYDAENSLHISIKLNRRTDADIIEKISRETNKQAYIKECIRNQAGKPE